MPFYHYINPGSTSGKRTVERLLALRQQLDRQIPKRSLSENLLLATWNIREFDSPAYGRRVPEAFYYIAEIIDRFDLVAVQEVRRDLKALDRLGRILGSHWKHIVTDVTEGSQGNKERMAFLYDSRKVRFGGLAGELVVPPIKTKDEDDETVYKPASQLARTPFLAGFSAGWTSFMLATLHILYGQSEAEDPDRIEEIRQIAQFLRNRSLDPSAWSRNLILLGDFNIFSPEDATMSAIKDAGFIVPEAIQSLPSNVAQNRHYDQIAFRVRNDRFSTTGKAGVFNFYETVFTEEDEEIYISQMGSAYHTTSKGKPRTNKSSYYKTYWRTHQMSDHLPMWVELKIDFSNEYLARKLEEGSE
jgi:exonuclease III